MLEGNQNKTTTPIQASMQIEEALSNLEQKSGEQTNEDSKESSSETPLYKFGDAAITHITLRLAGSQYETAKKVAKLFNGKSYRSFSTIKDTLKTKNLSLSNKQINAILKKIPHDEHCLTEESEQQIKNIIIFPNRHIIEGKLNDQLGNTVGRIDLKLPKSSKQSFLRK